MNDYQTYLNSEGWKAKRAMILNMWGNRCALCNEGGLLQVHHRTYERKGNENPFDLIPLCEKHHEMLNPKQEPELELSYEQSVRAAVAKMTLCLEIELDTPENLNHRENIKKNIEGIKLRYEATTGERFIS